MTNWQFDFSKLKMLVFPVQVKGNGREEHGLPCRTSDPSSRRNALGGRPHPSSCSPRPESRDLQKSMQMQHAGSRGCRIVGWVGTACHDVVNVLCMFNHFLV